MKVYEKAGIASAAFAVATIFAIPAQAADLGGYSGGSVKDGYVPLPQVSAGGAGPCYFRADVGYSWSRDPSASWPVTSSAFDGADADADGFADGDANQDGIIDANEITTTYLGSAVSNASLENTWLGEVGAGCGSGSRGLRAEVMFGFRGDRGFTGEPLPYDPGPNPGDPTGVVPPPVVDDPMHTSLRTYTLMLNLYKDLGNYGGFVPYIGAGIGAAYHQLDNIYFTENPHLSNQIHGNNDLAFAWSLMAGVGYQISDRAIIDVGYRYIDMGSITSQRSDTAFNVNPAVKFDDLTAHELKIGLRYHLGGGTQVVEHIPMK